MRSYNKIILLAAFILCVCPKFSYADDKSQENQQEPSEHWAFTSDTTFNATVVTGNSDSVTLGGSEKFKMKKKEVTNIFTSGLAYVWDDVFNNMPATTSTRNIFAKDKFIWDFYKRFYSYIGSGWLTNQTSGVNNQYDGFIGFGYKLLVLEKHKLNIEVGYQIEQQDRVSPFPDEGIYNSAAFGFDYLWQMADKTFLEEEAETDLDVKNSANYRISSMTQLKVEIIKHLALTLGYKLQFDNTPVPTFKNWPPFLLQV